MDLRRAFERFADHELSRFDKASGTFTPTGQRGALQVYDRFVSDRDFGQKKRIFLCPGVFSIPLNETLLQISDVPGVWLIEGSNADADASGVYASAVVLREARHKVKLWKKGGTKKRATGVGYIDTGLQLIGETWGDFSRYSSTESRELQGIDYTIGSWYLPLGTSVSLDTLIEDEFGQFFMVREVSSFLDLLMVRAQEREDTV